MRCPNAMPADSADGSLFPYRVMLREQSRLEPELGLECLAKDEKHAAEQGANARPDCEVAFVMPVDRSAQAYAIYSPNESTLFDGSGFWCHESGMWTPFPWATRFSYAQTLTMGLPRGTGADARWVLWKEACASYGWSLWESATVRLVLDVTYSPNEACVTDLADRLEEFFRRAITGAGIPTSGTAAKVERYSVRTSVLPEIPSEGELAECIRRCIGAGELDLKDLPACLARHGLMDPIAFVWHMIRRMDNGNLA